jgi:glycerol-3-phosphate acyltransferase PlsY
MMGLLGIAIAYLLGSIPFGYLLTRFATGRDVRTEGSGNIGATNVVRAAGRGVGLATLALDMAKGTFAVWIAGWLTDGSPGWMADVALAVMAGHAFPVFLNFKGGKTVATFAGAFVYLMPLPLLASVAVFAIIVAATRYVSAGSLVGAAMFPLGAWIILHPSLTEMLAAILGCGFIIYRHLENLERIRAGAEPRFHWSKR